MAHFCVSIPVRYPLGSLFSIFALPVLKFLKRVGILTDKDDSLAAVSSSEENDPQQPATQENNIADYQSDHFESTDASHVSQFLETIALADKVGQAIRGSENDNGSGQKTSAQYKDNLKKATAALHLNEHRWSWAKDKKFEKLLHFFNFGRKIYIPLMSAAVTGMLAWIGIQYGVWFWSMISGWAKGVALNPNIFTGSPASMSSVAELTVAWIAIAIASIYLLRAGYKSWQQFDSNRALQSQSNEALDELFNNQEVKNNPKLAEKLSQLILGESDTWYKTYQRFRFDAQVAESVGFMLRCVVFAGTAPAMIGTTDLYSVNVTGMTNIIGVFVGLMAISLTLQMLRSWSESNMAKAKEVAIATVKVKDAYEFHLKNNKTLDEQQSPEGEIGTVLDEDRVLETPHLPNSPSGSPASKRGIAGSFDGSNGSPDSVEGVQVVGEYPSLAQGFHLNVNLNDQQLTPAIISDTQDLTLQNKEEQFKPAIFEFVVEAQPTSSALSLPNDFDPPKEEDSKPLALGPPISKTEYVDYPAEELDLVDRGKTDEEDIPFAAQQKHSAYIGLGKTGFFRHQKPAARGENIDLGKTDFIREISPILENSEAFYSTQLAS